MLQLTYISTATTAVDQVQVDAILAASRRNNGADGITGLLLYDGQRFLQALEGPADAVNAAYTRIKADPRHRAVVMLSSRQVEARAFGEWAMAAERVTPGEARSMPEQVEALTAELEDRTLQALFRSYAKVRAAA
jgi:hypothetical protein